MNQKPAILIITELFPNEEISFLGSFVFSQLKALGEYYKIVVIVPVSLKVKTGSRFVKSGDMDIYYIKSYASFVPLILCRFGLCKPGKAFVWRKRILAKSIEILSKKINNKYHFDLVHGHEPYVGDEAAVVGKKLNIPSVVTIHSLYEYHQRLFGADILPKIVKNLNQADKIFAVSKISAESYLRNGVNHDFEIIPNGIGDYKTSSLPDSLKSALRGKTVIMCVGFFVVEKRIEQLVYAAAELKKKYKNSFAVIIIGTGALENLYKEIAKNNGMEDQILILGQIPPSEIMSYYAFSDFVVHPSVIESFSMVCLEAMAAGKPFICTSNIGITEYITNEKEAFIIPPDNIGSLVEKIDILLGDPSLREKMGRAAGETAQKFRWKNQIGKILKIYSSLADNRGK